MKKTIFVAGMMFAGMASPADIAEKYPVSENVRGHENTEWSQSYAYHLTDAKKDLPRVLLVGDSVCRAYAGGVGKILWQSGLTLLASDILLVPLFALHYSRYAMYWRLAVSSKE